MSYSLDTIDLSAVSVGQGGQVTLDPVKFKTASNPAASQENAHIRLYNESGSFLKVWTDTSSISDYVPAGGWSTFEIEPDVAKINFSVVAKMINPPVQLLLPTYYVPGEKVPETPQLGNSPISGVTQTSSIQTLSNEGAAANLLVIDLGDTAFNQLVALFNDGHALWAVDQSGVKHQVIKINIAGNPLQLGQAGDTVEQLGNEKVDGTFESVGNATLDGTLGVTGVTTTAGGVNTGTIRDNSTGAPQITLVTAGITIVNKATFSASPAADASGPVNFTAGGGVNNAITRGGLEIIAYNTTTGDTELKATSVGGRVLLTTSDGTARAQADSTGFVGLTGSIFFPVAGSFKSVTRFTGTGNGTVATGTVNPFSIANDACTLSGSSQTIGMTIASSSVVTTGAALAWHGTAYN